MAGEMTQDMLYAELLKLDERSRELAESYHELVVFMKDMNRELAEGRAKTDALKKALFGNRFDRQGAVLG
ncbi:hypothetical protein [Rhizobium sp. SL86]|jgi:hypothetical protein|uniref:hypothetical protein n=1 Tax=Rhizobium sp. SL86 TaxID=2995148 RepID=UPI0022757970|nr:hypothetical protein [Rhizobium sp. SL86]MCY1668840.1 hypothetical protein [Rhizobium sp. SL86]